MAHSFMTITKELSKCKLDSVGIQVRLNSCGTEPAGVYTSFYRKRTENHELHTGFFVHKRIILEVTGVEFVSDWMS
jgi:hypothetical protein